MRSRGAQKRPEKGSASPGGFSGVAGAALGPGAGVGAVALLVAGRGRKPDEASSFAARPGPLDGAAEGSGGIALRASTGPTEGGVVTVGMGETGTGGAVFTLAIGSPGGGDEGDNEGPPPRPSSAAAATTTTVPTAKATTLRNVRVFDLRFEMIVLAAADTGGSSAR